jgi:rubredoxin
MQMAAKPREGMERRTLRPCHRALRPGRLDTIAGILLERPPNTVTDPKTWMCLICGWIYDEAAGAPDDGIAPGTLWADVPMNWTCPECGARKEDFEMVQI